MAIYNGTLELSNTTEKSGDQLYSFSFEREHVCVELDGEFYLLLDNFKHYHDRSFSIGLKMYRLNY